MDKKKTSSWLIGCGIGCGAIVLAGIVLAVVGFVGVRKTVAGFDEAVIIHAELEQKHGRARNFTPTPDGSISAERMEIFLKTRESLAGSRGKIAAVFEKLTLSEDEARELDEKPLSEKVLSILEIGKSAMGMGAELGNFFRDRNAALGEFGMGFGEYSYIYVLAYYGFLEHSPKAGPGTQARNEGADGESPESVQDDFGPGVSSRLQRTLVKILENQMESLPDDAPGFLVAALEEEIEAMKKDEDRLPWQDDLPAGIRASLEPFRERLESNYNASCNPFELARTRKRGRFSYSTD